jgi:hypothetical protein
MAIELSEITSKATINGASNVDAPLNEEERRVVDSMTILWIHNQ